jgi:hypothetical protein
MRGILIALAACSLLACAKAANDDLTDATGGPATDAAIADTGPKKDYGSADASHPPSDGGTPQDSASPPDETDATIDPPDTNVDPPDTSTGGGTCDINDPLMQAKYFAAAFDPNAKLCTQGCTGAECCFLLFCLQ